MWNEADWIHAVKDFKRQTEAWDLISAGMGEPSTVLSRWVAWPDWSPEWWSTLLFLRRSLPTSDCHSGFVVGGVGALRLREAQNCAGRGGSAALTRLGPASSRCTWARLGRGLDGSGWPRCIARRDWQRLGRMYPALALYAEPPAGPLTMGGASAQALGPSWGRRFAADCPQHERGRHPPHVGGAGAVRAAVPGKGGCCGTVRPGLGTGHRTHSGRPFVRLSGAARSLALLGRGEGGLLRAGPGRAAGKLPGRGERPTVCSGDSEPSRHSSSGFSAGGFHLRWAVTGVKSLRSSGPAGEFEAGPHPPAFPSTHLGPCGRNSGPS